MLSRIVGSSNDRSIFTPPLAAVAELEDAVGTVEADQLGPLGSISLSENGFGLSQSGHVHRGRPEHRGCEFNAVGHGPLPNGNT